MKESKEELNQRLFENIQKILLNEDRPSIKLDALSKTEEFIKSDFNLLNRMKETEQSKVHHPEGDVWVHTMMVVDEAAKVKEQSKDKVIFMWSALLHDIGKPEATRIRKGKITAYDHDKIGEKRAVELLNKVCKDPDMIEKIRAMVRWHMQILFVAKNNAFADLDRMIEDVDVDEVALLGMCDRLGRGGGERNQVMLDINEFLRQVNKKDERQNH